MSARRNTNSGMNNNNTSTSPIPTVNTRRSAKKTLTQEDIEALPNTVKNHESAVKYLNQNLLNLSDEPFTLTHIISILFHITQISPSTPTPVISAIRAVAFILKNMVADEIADRVAEKVTTTVISTLSQRIENSIATNLSPHIGKLLLASDSLESSCNKNRQLFQDQERSKAEGENNLREAAESFQESSDMIYTSTEDCHNAIKSLTPTIDATRNLLISLKANPLNPNPLIPQPTYSQIAAANIPVPVEKALSRAATRACQILLSGTMGTAIFPPLTPREEIKKKLKEALEAVRNDTTPNGGIKTWTQFPSGSLAVEFDNEALAHWFHDPTNKQLLVDQFNSPIEIRNHYFPVVIEFLPTQLQLEREDLLREIGRENNLMENSLVSMRWIKPLARRNQAQKRAFALLQVLEASTANHIIKQSLCIHNERFTARKDKKEPIRCAKCQQFAHIARNCVALHDTCGNCGGTHRTNDCRRHRPDHCVNCKTNDHPSWSKNCPEYTRRCAAMNARYPENNMPYYPTDLIWTHVTEPPCPNPLNDQDLHPPQDEPRRTARITQTKLTFPNQQRPRNNHRPQVRARSSLNPPRNPPSPIRSSSPPPDPPHSPSPSPIPSALPSTRTWADEVDSIMNRTNLPSTHTNV